MKSVGFKGKGHVMGNKLRLFVLLFLIHPYVNANSESNGIPLLGLWEQHMIEYGKKWGEYITSEKHTEEERLAATYYDSTRVFYQISQYLGQTEPWLNYARSASITYQENYCKRNDFRIPGYWRFSKGILFDYINSSNRKYYRYLALMRDRPAFSNPVTYRYADTMWYWQKFSREIAYALLSHVAAERAGYPRQDAKVKKYLEMSLKHIDEWVTGRYANPNVREHRLSPFMVGLTAEALIELYEWDQKSLRESDPRIPQAIKRIADHLWYKAIVKTGKNKGKPLWVNDVGGSSGDWNDYGGRGGGAFRYEDIKGAMPAPDLNLLIAPMYAWLYKHYRDEEYRKIADEIWIGGVKLAAIGWSSKIFNQNYRWSFKFVKWRQEDMGNKP